VAGLTAVPWGLKTLYRHLKAAADISGFLSFFLSFFSLTIACRIRVSISEYDILVMASGVVEKSIVEW